MTQPTPGSAPVEPAADDQVVTPEADPAPEPEVQYIQLRRDQLYSELARLESEDPEVKRVVGSYIGNKAARQYQPEIRRRDTEIAQLNEKLFAAEVKSMDEKAIEDRISTDREWGKRYLDYAHEQRNGKTAQPVDERPLVEAALAEIMDYGRRNGLSDADWNQFISKAQSGGYGNDAWQVSLTRMQQDVADFVRQGAGRKVEPTIVQKTNPALTKGGPDLTSGSRTGAGVSGAFPTTAKEFNALPRAKQMELMSSDREKVVALSNK